MHNEIHANYRQPKFRKLEVRRGYRFLCSLTLRPPVYDPTMNLDEKEVLACCGSTAFAQQMASATRFLSLDQAVSVARDIWFNKVDVKGWLEAFAAHPQIGESPSSSSQATSAQWSKGEQSTALATANTSSLQELSEWNARYKQKFGHIFIICASGRSAAEILAELKKRYSNRPIIEFEIAAQEQMKVTELRLAKLFSSKMTSMEEHDQISVARKAEEDRVSVIGGHLTAPAEPLSGQTSKGPTRTRPPITTHVLDVSRGCPAAGVEVLLELWKGTHPSPMFGQADTVGWVHQGSSTTDKDGRSGQLMSMIDALSPGVYRISFNTGKYWPAGFFPFVSIVFQVRESQKWEHFHVPLLLSPFSFSTYRGS